MGPVLGAPKVEKCNFWEIQMADCDHIVHQRKKFRKQKSSVLLSYNWNVPKFVVSHQALVNFGQKYISPEFGHLKQTGSKDDLSMPVFSPRGNYFGDFLINPLYCA